MSVVDQAPDPQFLTPEAPAAGPLRLKMIKPPSRGDKPARDYLVVGTVFYGVFSILFLISLLGGRPDKGMALRELFGVGAQPNFIIFILIVTGLALTIYAGWTVWADTLAIAREEADVDWVLNHEREGLMLVFADPKERLTRLRRGELTLRPGETPHVETLVDDRVRRVHQARLDGGAAHIPVEELRGIAETRTLQYGHVARFASSLLLLLAVLGTFAGVKTALPSLIDAISGAGGAGGGDANSMVGPLRAVADAFGGNALALVGAIAVGLMAQGLSVGRRHLLERLELVSAEYIYETTRAQNADPLIAAVGTLSGAAQAVREASGSFLGLESSLQGLSHSFQAGFDTLNDQLADLMRQQDEALHERTSKALEELQSRVVTLAGAVEANTRQYGGLVDRVGERAAESREAFAQMKAASETLSQALTGILQTRDASARATESIEKGIEVLVTGTSSVDARMAAVAEAVDHARPAMQEVEAAVRAAAARVEGIDARAAQHWKEAADEVKSQFESLARTQVHPAASAGGGGLSPDAVTLLRRIAAAAEASRGPSPVRIAVSCMAGVLGATAVVFVIANLPGWIAALRS
jgi:uncharacterized protein YoxC